MANKNTSVKLPLFSLPRNIQWPDCSAPPKSSWNSRLKEHIGVQAGITVHLRGEILEFSCLPRAPGMSCRLWIALVNMQPPHSLVPIRVEHSGLHHDQWLVEAVCNIVGSSLLVFNVQIELWKVCGPFLLAIVLQLSLCLYELQGSMVCGYCFLPQNVMLPLSTRLHNGIHLFVHRWDTFRLCLNVSHCGMPLDSPVE